MVYSKYNLLLKAKLVHTQVPDAASDDDGPDQCAHHNPNIAQNMVKHGIQQQIW